MMDLLGTLPAEVLQKIADHLFPDSLFSLALTCKRVYNCISTRVEAQKNFAEKYSTVDNTHALSILTALRRILVDPIAAWHLRSINIWQKRGIIAPHNSGFVTQDFEYLPCGLRNQYLQEGQDCKEIHRRLHRRWEDLVYLGNGVSHEGGPVSSKEVAREDFDPSRHPPILEDCSKVTFLSHGESQIYAQLLEEYGMAANEQDPYSSYRNWRMMTAVQRYNWDMELAHMDEARLIFLLITCAPRLRDVWCTQPVRTWFSTISVFLELHDPSKGNAYLGPGFLALRHVYLGGGALRPSSERYHRNISILEIFPYLALPNLELFRLTRHITRGEFQDQPHVFEWECKTGSLRETVMTCASEAEYLGPIGSCNIEAVWEMLSPKLKDGVVSYECSNSTVAGLRVLNHCFGRTLETLHITGDTPQGSDCILGGFSNLKTLIVGIDYFIQHQDCIETKPLLPTSLEHLMVHSESHADKRPPEEDQRLQWSQTMRERGVHLISKLLHMLTDGQISKLRSMCLIRIWGDAVPEVLKSLIALVMERSISLHLWSGSPDPNARTCAHLCGRLVTGTKKDQTRWPNLPLSWGLYSTYNWVTGRDEFQYGKNPHQICFPLTNQKLEIPFEFVGEWDEQFFRNQLREIYTTQSTNASVEDMDKLVGEHFGEDGRLSSLSESMLELLVDRIYERYKIEEDKARRVKESMEIGQKVSSQLGGEGGKLVCLDYTWQRVSKFSDVSKIVDGEEILEHL